MKSQYLESVDEGGTCHGIKRKRQTEREEIERELSFFI